MSIIWHKIVKKKAINVFFENKKIKLKEKIEKVKYLATILEKKY